MAKENNKMNIYQKVVEVRKEVKYIKKDAQGHHYSYANESQILGMIRDKMDDMNLVLEQEAESTEMLEISGKTYIRIEFSFIWTDADNPSDKIVKHMTMIELFKDIKTIGSIQTYAMKYHLYKFFNVATDKDDHDAHQERVKKNRAPAKISEVQIKHIKKLIGDRQDIEERILPWAQIDKIEDLTTDKYPTVIKAIASIKKEEGEE